MPTKEKRILIVDDDDAIRTLLFTILRRQGFAVDGARNGLEALARLRMCVYSVMLLDLMMPMKSGWDVLDELKKLPAEARPMVFVLTAGNEPSDLDPAIVAGSIRKPFDVELLMATVTACMNALTERPQLPGCPLPDSAPDSATAPTEKVN
jgi:DNA-binding response OmpR family regulator